MVELNKPSIELFKDMVEIHHQVILQQVSEIIETRPDLKDVFCDPKNVTKKTLQWSFHRGYHKHGDFRFVRDTVDLAQTVLDNLVDEKRRADIVLFLESYDLSA